MPHPLIETHARPQETRETKEIRQTYYFCKIKNIRNFARQWAWCAQRISNRIITRKNI